MIYQVCAIRDAALNAYTNPFIANTVNQAIRMFMEELQRHNSPIYKHPQDFDLYLLGTWDNETGAHENQNIRMIARGTDSLNAINQTLNKE